MPEAYIDRNGITLPSYPEVLDFLKGQMREIYGEDIYLEPDSQDGQLLAIFALALQDTYALAESVYNAYSPQTAQGAGLSRMVAINGIRRKAASYSTVDLRLIGQPGTVIHNGAAADSANNKWLLPETVTIGLDGEAYVTARAEKIGDIRAAAGEITTIATPTRGWQSVENPLTATPGAPVELDAELRERQRWSVALPSRTVFEGVLGAIADLDGVLKWRGYENDTSRTDANGIPPHSICVVVEGGDAQAIADIIALKKTPGCGTWGDLQIDTYDSRGVPNKIYFFRPVGREVKVNVKISPLDGYVSSTAQAIKTAISAYINELPIGEDVIVSRLYCPINDTDAKQGSRTFDIVEVSAGYIDSLTMTTDILAIAYTDMAVSYADDVEVEIV